MTRALLLEALILVIWIALLSFAEPVARLFQ